MIDAKILNGVSTLLRAYGRLTCGVLAEKNEDASLVNGVFPA